jgi:hypothetical protein
MVTHTLKKVFLDLKIVIFLLKELNLSPARVVLEVTLEGSARKLVTVRSALQIVNKLPHTVEVKLDNTHLQKNC